MHLQWSQYTDKTNRFTTAHMNKQKSLIRWLGALWDICIWSINDVLLDHLTLVRYSSVAMIRSDPVPMCIYIPLHIISYMRFRSLDNISHVERSGELEHRGAFGELVSILIHFLFLSISVIVTYRLLTLFGITYKVCQYWENFFVVVAKVNL